MHPDQDLLIFNAGQIMVGITAYGAYLPRLRLQKKVIADANGWFDSGLVGLGKGEKAMCNWD